MMSIAPFEKKIKAYENWFEKFPFEYQTEILAIHEQLVQLPRSIRGIEIGVGTGRFSGPLGIKEGVGSSWGMRRIAKKKGIEVRNAKAEKLPYEDLQFDFVLFVTVCHLKNVKSALREAHRVLKRNGSLIIGFIDGDSYIGQSYKEKRKESALYRDANFLSVDKVNSLLKETRFTTPVFTQTLFSSTEGLKEVEASKKGTGEGGFVVVRAQKRP